MCFAWLVSTNLLNHLSGTFANSRPMQTYHLKAFMFLHMISSLPYYVRSSVGKHISKHLNPINCSYPRIETSYLKRLHGNALVGTR